MKKRKTIRRTFLFATICFGIWGLWVANRWIQDVREYRKQESFSPPPSSLKNPPSSPAKNNIGSDLEKSPITSENSPYASGDSRPSSSQNESPPPRSETPPLMPVCAEMQKYFYGKIGNRLQKEAQEGKTENRRVIGKLLNLSASRTATELTMRLPHDQNLAAWTSQYREVFENAWYAKELLLAEKELNENLKLAQNLENKSYRAYFLGKIMLARPELMNDSSFLSACHEIETEEMPIEEMNRLVLELATRSQVTAEEIGFDPQWKSDLEVRWEKYGPLYRRGLYEKLKSK